MKKLNKKGLGHHMLLAIVAVVAVVGAAGYFVWQRQGDGIDAKAAGLAYIAPSNTTASKYLKMYACKNPSRLGAGNFVVSFGGQRLTSNTSAYRIIRSGATWRTVYFSSTYAYPTNKEAMQAYKTDKIDFQYIVSSGGLPSEPITYGSIVAEKIPNC